MRNIEFHKYHPANMARVLVDGQRERSFSKGVSEASNKIHNGVSLGRFGELIRIPIKIEYESSSDDPYDYISLSASVNCESKENEQMAKGYSRLGFWLGMHDHPTGDDEDANRFFMTSVHPENPEGSEYSSVDVCGYATDIQSWKFGKKATLSLRIEDNPSTQDLMMIVRPFFPMNVDRVTLKFSLRGQSYTGGTRDIHDCRIELKVSEDAPQELPTSRWYLEHGAYNWIGKGSSVHPKQLHTSHALRHVLNKHVFAQRENKSSAVQNVRIAYIGPDTTENLRTVIRTLSELRASHAFDVELYVIYLSEWDWKTAINPFKGGSLDLANPPKWVTLQGIEMSDIQEGSIKKSSDFPGSIPSLQSDFLKNPNVDLVLATYVTPWSLGTDEKDKMRYQSVLEKLVTGSTFFVTVDPGTIQNCVLELPPEHGVQQLNDFYENRLNFIGAEIMWNNSTPRGEDFPQISAMLWEAKPEES